MKRLGAVVLAIAMIGGAWVLRDRLDGDDGSGGTGGGGGDDVEQVRLRCATELERVCRQLAEGRDDVQVSVEDPGTTSDALVALPEGDDPGFDAWLVDAPWAEITADNRGFANATGTVLGEPSPVLARSPAVLVIADAAQALLPQDCEPRASWTCIGTAGANVRVGVPSPERGDGLVVLAGATAEFLGTSDYSANDFDTPGFTGWFDRITNLSASTRLGRQSPLEAALTRQGLFNVVGALEAQSTDLLRTRSGWATTYPSPVVTADVTLVPAAGLAADELVDQLGADELADALRSQGWRVDGSVPDGGDAEVELPEGSGLPAPGVLQQLRERW